MFLQRLNDMIDAFSATARGAAEVRNGVQLVADAINDAREQLAPLVARYAKAQAAPDPRVGRQAQRLLDEEARRILMATDVTVRDASPKFAVALPSYSRISTQTYISPASGGTTATAGAGGGASGMRNASNRLSELAPPRFDPPVPSVDDIIDADVELAGSQADVGGAARRLGDLRTVPSDGVPPIGYQAPIGGVGRVLGGGSVIGVNANSSDGAVRGPGTTTRGAPGSVIGGAPVTSTAGSARTRPMLGPLGSARPTTGRPAGGAGGYQDRSFDEYVARRREPGDEQAEQWTVQRGVSPLLEARPPVRDHDPGPGVIGLDR